jgi:hypothetical protein
MTTEQRVLVHTVDQPTVHIANPGEPVDTTTFVLSCNRLAVLDQTLQSFWATSTDYTTKLVIVDDSAVTGVFATLVERYGHVADILCFPRNRSQWWALDFMVSYCDSEYIFYLEDDWLLTQPGYLRKSRAILQKYRDVGVVDISWRTFAWQGIDSYESETLVDGEFYWKKPFKITDGHLAWHLWCGSPNLKRRDDLLMLGRVEKWHNEWNIDRKFTALGFRGVFLNGEYARHLGDDCSVMAGRRPDDSLTPHDFVPAELQQRRELVVDYSALDQNYEYPDDVTLVTLVLDLGRHDRLFATHYLSSLDQLLAVRQPLVIYADPQHHAYLQDRRQMFNVGTSDNRLTLRSFTLEQLEQHPVYKAVQPIMATTAWQTQSAWLPNSVLTQSPHYVPLTLLKTELLASEAAHWSTLSSTTVKKPFIAKRFFWIDAGLFSSFQIQDPIKAFDFLRLGKDINKDIGKDKSSFSKDKSSFTTNKLCLASFPYNQLNEPEIHGFSKAIFSKLTGGAPVPPYVCRATLFGGTTEAIKNFKIRFDECLAAALAEGAIGTEEALFTLVERLYPDLVNRYEMPSGDIAHYMATIKRK